MQDQTTADETDAQKVIAKLRRLQFAMTYIAIAALFILAIMVAGAVRLSMIEAAQGASSIARLLVLYSSMLLLFVFASATAIFAFYWKYNRSAVNLMEGMLNPDSGQLSGDKSSPWYAWAFAIDTDRAKTAQNIASLKEQGDLRTAILESAIDGIVTSNEHGVITDFNPAAETMFGWSRNDIIGLKMEDTIVPPAFRDGHRNGMARYTEERQKSLMGRKVEMQGLHKEGAVFPIELAIAEAIVGGARIFVGYIRDLSAQNQTQAELLTAKESLHQSEKLTALGSLLAGVAHELNNPLAIVVGRAAILEEKLANSPHLAPIQKLRAAADRCSRIVKTFLAMARQSGPRRSLVQLNDLIEGALDMTAYGLRSDSIEVRQELGPDLPITSADEDQLVQVMINLIVNAQQAMASTIGPHQLTIRTMHDSKSDCVVIEVEDSGPGIPSELTTRIFEPFFTTKDVGAGTGMGLSVSRGMMEAQGGSLSLVRNGAKGATFRVTLPILRDEETDHAIPATNQDAEVKGRILIVDDEPELAALLVECLEPLGVVCSLAHDGQDALKQVARITFNAVFTDVRMPGMDGLAFYAHLQAHNPELAKRLAFISGDVLHNDTARLAAIGDRLVIEKPFDPQQVRDVARALIAIGTPS